MASDRSPRTAILLAAGRGNRLRPYTDNTPKPLLPYKKKPIIDYMLVALKSTDIEKLCIVTNHLEEQLITYVSQKYKKHFDITFCHQEHIAGTADAVLCTKEYLKREIATKQPLLISATDYVVAQDYIKDLVQCHIANAADVTISLREVKKNKIKQSSLVIIRRGLQVGKIIEKPEGRITGTYLAATLMYVVPTVIFDYLSKMPLSKRGEYELPDVMNMMIDDGLCTKGCLQAALIDLEKTLITQ